MEIERHKRVIYNKDNFYFTKKDNYIRKPSNNHYEL